MQDFKHIKIRKVERMADGSDKITSESYYENLASTRIEYEKKIKTSRAMLLRDIVTCLEHLTVDNSPQVDISIRAEYGEPRVIIKKWIVKTENHPRQ